MAPELMGDSFGMVPDLCMLQVGSTKCRKVQYASVAMVMNLLELPGVQAMSLTYLHVDPCIEWPDYVITALL